MIVPTRIPTTTQLRSLEAAWIESCHSHWGMVLMEVAGRRAAEIALAMFESNLEVSLGPVAIFCGRGNNGGDGLVVARYLSLWDIPIVVFMVGSPEEKSTGARQESIINREILEKLDVPINYLNDNSEEIIEDTLSISAIVVDALFGTGLDRPIKDGVYKQIIDAINNSGKPVLSVDVPSGINSDTGQIMGTAVRADVTTTFGYLKAGLLCHPGASLSGVINLVDIGLPPLEALSSNLKDPNQCWLSSTPAVQSLLPARPINSHKGTFGHLLTIAGSPGMAGSARMASKTALKTGTGLCILSLPKSMLTTMPPEEVIYHPLAETSEGTISPKAIADLESQMEKATAVVLGPGISSNKETVKFVQQLVKVIKKPCLIDADGLNAIAENTSCWPDDALNFVLTPHPKELSRLLGISTEEIQANRIFAAQKASAKFGCTVVLKGANSIIVGPSQIAFINPTGNSGMATAGAGDVLSGIIGGLLAQGLTPFDAAIAGTYIHGAAGDLAAESLGEVGIVAGDIMDFVPDFLDQLRKGEYRGSHLELNLIEPQV